MSQHSHPQQISASSSEFQALLARHHAFWTRAEENSYLSSIGLNTASLPLRLRQRDGRYIINAERLEPHMIDPDDLVREAEEWDASRLDPTLISQGQYLISVGKGDTLPYCSPLSKIPWPEAMLGIPIRMTEGQIWNENYPSDPEEVIQRASSLERNPWFELYVEFQRQLQARLGHRFPLIARSHRGPSDLVVAVLGAQAACVGWLDRPAFMARLMRVCTDLLLKLKEVGGKIVQPIRGGFVSGHCLWVPGPVVSTQADHAALISPRMYKNQVLPYDLEIIRSCPYSDFHLHSAGLHIAPILVEIPELSVIQVSIDPSPLGERRPNEVAMMQMIQEHKPLIVSQCPSNMADADWLRSQFSTRGLHFVLGLDPEVYAMVPAEAPARRVWLLEP